MNDPERLSARNCLSVHHLTHHLDEPVESTRFYKVWVERADKGRASALSHAVRVTDEGVLETLEGGKAISRERYSVYKVEAL